MAVETILLQDTFDLTTREIQVIMASLLSLYISILLLYMVKNYKKVKEEYIIAENFLGFYVRLLTREPVHTSDDFAEKYHDLIKEHSEVILEIDESESGEKIHISISPEEYRSLKSVLKKIEKAESNAEEDVSNGNKW